MKMVKLIALYTAVPFVAVACAIVFCLVLLVASTFEVAENLRRR